MGVAIKTPDAVLYIDLCLSDVVREQLGDFWTRGYAAASDARADRQRRFLFHFP